MTTADELSWSLALTSAENWPKGLIIMHHDRWSAVFFFVQADLFRRRWSSALFFFICVSADQCFSFSSAIFFFVSAVQRLYGHHCQRSSAVLPITADTQTHNREPALTKKKIGDQRWRPLISCYDISGADISADHWRHADKRWKLAEGSHQRWRTLTSWPIGTYGWHFSQEFH